MFTLNHIGILLSAKVLTDFPCLCCGSCSCLGVELDAAMLEREAEDAKRYLRDANCQRIWLEVRLSSNSTA